MISVLKEKFGECKRTAESKCNLKTSFEIINLRFFYIFDDRDDQSEEPVRVVEYNDDYQLRIQNSDRKEICLVKTDNCLFNDDHKKCDCILFSNNQLFFVEISEAKEKNKKRNDAVKQLGITIELFLSNDVDLSNFESKAIICFKSGKTKPTQSSFNSKRALFAEKYKISLEEGNFISF